MVRKAHLSVVQTEPGQISNGKLVEGLVARDSDAARSLYGRYEDRINRLVWRMLPADNEHNDVVNQVFLNVFKQIGTLREPDDLDRWVVSIALNTVRKEIRDRRRRYSWGFKEKKEPPFTRENQESVRKAKNVFVLLDQMKTEHRIVFVLRFVEQYRIQEISEFTGRSTSTVNRQLAAAKQRFLKLASRDVSLQGMFDGELK